MLATSVGCVLGLPDEGADACEYIFGRSVYLYARGRKGGGKWLGTVSGGVLCRMSPAGISALYGRGLRRDAGGVGSRDAYLAAGGAAASAGAGEWEFLATSGRRGPSISRLVEFEEPRVILVQHAINACVLGSVFLTWQEAKRCGLVWWTLYRPVGSDRGEGRAGGAERGALHLAC